MLMPKRVKYRKMQRGRMKGVATRGNVVSDGEFGLQATEPAWITANQIESARLRFSLTSQFLRNLLKLVWVVVKDLQNTGLRL